MRSSMAPGLPGALGRLVAESVTLRHLRELLQRRELVYYLVVRELRARYKNSILGFLWGLLNPLAMMVVFTIVFTVMVPNNQVANYPIFLLAGLLPWNYFSAGVMVGTSSVVGNAGLVKKVYFPPEVLPIASVLANLVNFLLALLVLFAVLIAFHSRLSPWLWLLPLVIIIETCFILGITFILSTLNVFFRDVLMIMDVVMLAWFFLTPIVYPMTSWPATFQRFGLVVDVRRVAYIVNPMASLTQTYRDLLYYGAHTNLDFFVRTTVTALAILALGYWFFVRYSSRFSEEL